VEVEVLKMRNNPLGLELLSLDGESGTEREGREMEGGKKRSVGGRVKIARVRKEN